MYEFIQYDVFAGNLDIIYCSYYFAGCNVTVSVGLVYCSWDDLADSSRREKGVEIAL